MKENSKVGGYTFHFNIVTELWSAIPRGQEKVYWNESDEDKAKVGILKSKELVDLLDYLTVK